MLLTDKGILIKEILDNNKIINYLCSISELNFVEYKGLSKSVNAFLKYNNFYLFPKFIFSEIDSDHNIGREILKIELINIHKSEDENKINKLIEKNKEFKLTDYQQQITDSFLSNFIFPEKNYGGGIIVMPCGAGKTLFAINLINYFKIKTLIIAPKKIIINQWINELKYYFDKTFDLLTIGAKNNISERTINDKPINDIDIIILSPNYLSKLIRKYNNLNILNNFKFLIIDEVHHMMGIEFHKIIQKKNFNYCVGLSATPDKENHSEKIYKVYLGPELRITMAEMYNNKFIFYMIYIKNVKIDYIYDGKNLNYSAMINNLIENKNYNSIIIQRINELKSFKEPNLKRILVLSHRVEHLNFLAENFDETDYYIMTSQSKNKIENNESDKAIIFGSYNMLSEGFNIKNINALIMATPVKKNIEQVIGRCNRKIHKYPIIICDLFSNNNVFISQNRYRENFYNKITNSQILKYNI